VVKAGRRVGRVAGVDRSLIKLEEGSLITGYLGVELLLV